MPDRTCSNCGAALGAGVLEGLCPRCLVAGNASVGSPESALVSVAAGSQADSRQNNPPPHSPAHSGRAAMPTPIERPTIDSGGTLGRDTLGLALGEHPAPALWSDRTAAPPIEGYELLREVKHGGQGVIYLAIQRSTKRKVAIKLLLAGRYASKSARRRFEREIELVASLKHPNIIAVFDSGTTADGCEYYVMDYVRGMPVTAYVREQKPTLEETLELFETVCEAVAHAHQRGVIHRDLKPGNVLVDVDGNARVLDFGLAKALTDPAESQGSITGNVIGTLQYMSPEQTRGNPDEIDTRTDVYALGVILYEMLTGRLPYPTTGDMADVIRKIAEAPPGRPSKCWSSDSGVLRRSRSGRYGRRGDRCPLDFDVETIVLKALAKDREHRYESAGQFARDLRRYLNGEQIVARRASAWYQFRVFARRNKAVVGAALAVLVVLAGGVVGVSWQWQRAEHEKIRAEAERGNAARAADALGNAMAFSGDYFAAQGDLLSARHLYTEALDQTARQGHPGTPILMGLLELSNRRGGDIPLLGSYGRDGGSGGFRGHTRHPNNVAVLTRSRTALTAGTDGRLIAWDLLTGRALQIEDPRMGTRTNPSGRQSEVALNYVAVSPDEKYAAVAAEDKTVTLYSLDPLQATGVVLSHNDPVWMVTLTNDLRVLTGTAKGVMTLWDGKTGMTVREYEQVKEGDESVAGLAFIPGHEQFALSGCGDGNVRLWDLRSEQPLAKLPGGHHYNFQVNCVAFSRDGKLALSACLDGTVTVYDVRPEDAGFKFGVKARLPHGRSVWRATFSPDATQVATASEGGTVAVWDVDTGKLRRVFKGQSGKVMGVAYADARTLVSSGEDSPDGAWHDTSSALKVWDLGGEDGGEASVQGPVSSVVIDDHGMASARTPGGVRTLYAGEDGRFHAARTPTGPASEPVTPARYGGPERMPRWGDGGSSGAASVSRAAAGAGTGAGWTPTSGVLATLAQGKGKLVAGAEGRLELWGPPGAGGSAEGGMSFARLRAFEGHKAPVVAAAVSPNGRYIVSADQLGTLRLRDLLRPARCRELEQQLSQAYDLMESDPASPTALSSLRAWYAFRGHDVGMKELVEKARAARSTGRVPADAK